MVRRGHGSISLLWHGWFAKIYDLKPPSNIILKILRNTSVVEPCPALKMSLFTSELALLSCADLVNHIHNKVYHKNSYLLEIKGFILRTLILCFLVVWFIRNLMVHLDLNLAMKQKAFEKSEISKQALNNRVCCTPQIFWGLVVRKRGERARWNSLVNS